MANVPQDKNPEFCDGLLELDESWKAISGDFVQEFEKILFEQRHSRDDSTKHNEVKCRITLVKRLITCADEMFELIEEYRMRLLSYSKGRRQGLACKNHVVVGLPHSWLACSFSLFQIQSFLQQKFLCSASSKIGYQLKSHEFEK